MYIIFLLVLILEFLTFSWQRDNYLLRQVTNFDRGTKTERMLVLKLLKFGIHPETIYHDLYVANTNGSYAQIDIVMATKVGIIVFEVKKYNGWIFGNGNQSRWIQLLAYGRKRYQFYSPVYQNNKHINDLKKQLSQFENIPFYSVIVFYGDCTLKNMSYIPKGTFIVKQQRALEAIKKIMNENASANYINKWEILSLFKTAANNGGNKDITTTHVANIKNMLDKQRNYI